MVKNSCHSLAAPRQRAYKVANLEIPVFVLQDGTRVISGRGFTAALGMKGRGRRIALPSLG